MPDCHEIRELLSGYLDAELYQQQRQSVRVHLERCPACRAEYEALASQRDELRALQLPEPQESEWSNTMQRIAFKSTRITGWLLWIGGAVVLALYGLYAFLRDPDVHVLERVGVLAVILGFVLLLITVLQERLAALKSDRYKDIQK